MADPALLPPLPSPSPHSSPGSTPMGPPPPGIQEGVLVPGDSVQDISEEEEDSKLISISSDISENPANEGKSLAHLLNIGTDFILAT